MAGVTWVAYIAQAMRENNEAALQYAHVECCREYGTGQTRDMFSLAKRRAAEADAAAKPVQQQLW